MSLMALASNDDRTAVLRAVNRMLPEYSDATRVFGCYLNLKELVLPEFKLTSKLFLGGRDVFGTKWVAARAPDTKLAPNCMKFRPESIGNAPGG